MHFECRVENLKTILGILERVSGKNPALPVLGSVLISVTKKSITLLATNLEVGVEVAVKGVVKKEGDIAIPSKILYSYISSLQDSDTLIVRADGLDIHIDTKQQQTVIRGIDHSDFPPFPEPEYTGALSLDLQQLIQRLRRVLVATTNFNIKQELASVFFNIENQILTLAATDSFRLAEEKFSGEGVTIGKDDPFPILIPVRALEELLRILETYSGEKVSMEASETGVLFHIGNIKLFSRVIDGKFPEYQAIIPQKFTTDTTINIKELIQTLKQAHVFTGKLNEVQLSIVAGEGVQVKTKSRDVGEFESLINSEIRGESVTVALNWKYVNDALSRITSNAVFIGVNGGQSPVIIKPVDEGGSVHVIMPMKSL